MSEEISPAPSYFRLEVVPACGPYGGGLELPRRCLQRPPPLIPFVYDHLECAFRSLEMHTEPQLIQSGTQHSNDN